MKNISVFSIAVMGALVAPVFAFAATPAPVCTSFEASRTHVKVGDRIDLTWETTGGTSLTISPNTFSTGLKSEVASGHVSVFPKEDTRYNLTVARASETDTCTLEVIVDGDARPQIAAAHTSRSVSLSDNTPRGSVVAYQMRDQGPVTAVAINGIPYTGVDMGAYLSGAFFFILALWLLAVFYAVRTKQSFSQLFK